MHSVLNNIVKDINDKIDKLRQEKWELAFILNNNSIVEEKIGEYFEEITRKFLELIKYIDVKIENYELKKKRYREELCKEYYGTWLSYIEEKKQHINNITETLDTLDTLDDLDISDIITITEIDLSENDKSELTKEKDA